MGSKTNGYILIHANGGLNQMRTGVSATINKCKLLYILIFSDPISFIITYKSFCFNPLNFLAGRNFTDL